MLQKIILRNYWPFLRFVNLKGLGGFYSRSGEDVLLASILFSHVIKNSSIKIIEINKPESYPYSLANVFFEFCACTAMLINTRNRLIFAAAKNAAELSGLKSTNDISSKDTYGCLNAYVNDSKLYEYSSNEQLVISMSKYSMEYSLVILSAEIESIQLLSELLGGLKIYCIIVLNNNSGFFSCGNTEIRNTLAQKGFVFHTRLNGNDDLFVLSEMVNGFPSNVSAQLNIDSLMRWVSPPPDSDYTVPK